MRLYYDLHIHSCLSPCADGDMTPQNIANMSALAGLNLIAVADHNSCRNCRGLAQAAKRAGLFFLPAMELTTAEEVHILCFFETLEGAEAFSDSLYSRIPDYPLDKRIYTGQTVMDGEDNPLYSEPKLLSTATNIDVYGVVEAIRPYGGFAVPAHVDRHSYSVISNLGMFDPAMGFRCVEFSIRCDPAAYLANRPDLEGYSHIQDSDAHSLGAMPDASNFIDLHSVSAKNIMNAILAGKPG